jgi:hypothetical protein
MPVALFRSCRLMYVILLPISSSEEFVVHTWEGVSLLRFLQPVTFECQFLLYGERSCVILPSYSCKHLSKNITIVCMDPIKHLSVS